jgi:hypothetical protein
LESTADAVVQIKESLDAHNRVQATNGELDRIVKRAGDLESSIWNIESDGTHLEQKPNEVLAAGRALTVRVAQLDSQALALRQALAVCDSQLVAAQSNGQLELAAVLATQFAAIDANLTAVSSDADTITAQGIALNAQAFSLWNLVCPSPSSSAI